MTSLTIERPIKVGHFFCGIGAGAKGFNRGSARVGNMVARFQCLGGIDNDPAAIRDFTRIAGVPGTLLDLFSAEQYQAFHGRMPPAGWREATVADIHNAFQNQRPNIIFLSAPCKGFSGLLSETVSKTAKYQALNGLTLRGVWLMLEAYAGDPPELIVFENVPRIAKRGRALLDQIIALLRHYGYAVAETAHDCGVLGGLAQSRKRFLLVARHVEKVPPFLYEPPKRALRGVGEVIGRLPMPGDLSAGVMHRCPNLQWKTWVRLAFVEAGSDWRSLNKLRVEAGELVDFRIAPEEADWHADALGVMGWDATSGAVTSRAGPTNGRFAVADPRFEGIDYKQYGVKRWEDTTGAVINVKAPGQGGFSVADPRIDGVRYNACYRIVRWGDASPAVAGPGGPGGGLAVSDPRADGGFGGKGKYRVTAFDEAAGTVISGSTTGQGAFALADPRPGFGPATHHNIMQVHGWSDTAKVVTGGTHPTGGALSVADPRPEKFKEGREHYVTGGHYGVVPWEEHSGAVTGARQAACGPCSVADPRPAEGSPIAKAPQQDEKLVAVIRALDGTWHRPFTTLELAALQGLVDPEEHLELDGLSDSAWRERIGNAVPPPAAEAIAGVMGRTLLLAWSGETFMLSSEPIWVQPIVVGLMAAQAGAA